MRRGLLVVASAFALALAAAGPAQAFTAHDTAIRMDDGVDIAATLFRPDGAPPPTGWPAVMLLHGLGESRTAMNGVGITLNDIAAKYLAPAGYVVLTFDIRAHGASGGLFTLDGPREVQDTRALFDWLTAQPGVDAKRVGAFGYSLGGGLLWRAAVEGVPFAVIEAAITWTDLYRALIPQNLPRSGVVAGFLNSLRPERIAPDLLALSTDLLTGTKLDVIKPILASRSTRGSLGRIRAPTLLLQGRRDFAFDLAQAIDAYRELRTPKYIYFADFGHVPSSLPPAEVPHAMMLGRRWFDRFLQGVPNGVDKRRVELAPDPWTGKTATYRSLPAVKTLSFAAGRSSTIGPTAKVVGLLARTQTRLETFGAPVVRVPVILRGGWERVVAVLSARTPGGKELLVSEGGVPTRGLSGRRRLSIRLSSQATLIPRRSSLTLTLAASSQAQNPNNLFYLDLPMPASARITIGRATVALPVLRKPVSR